MSTRGKTALQALKSRLTASGAYNGVHVGKDLSDPDIDTYPIVSVLMAKKGVGVTTDDDEPPSLPGRRRVVMHLAVEVHATVSTTDPLIDLEDVHETLLSALDAGTDIDLSGGKAQIKYEGRLSYPPESGSDVAILQQQIALHYVEG